MCFISPGKKLSEAHASRGILFLKKCMNLVGLIFEVSFNITEGLGQVTIVCLSLQARQQTMESHNFGKNISN